jgi:DNA-binding transcriptional ArsR family regulator
MSLLATDGTLEISDVATLRAVADPLRMRLLGLLESGDRTVKELAVSLGVRPNRLYYHVRLLEEHGLIKVASTRMVSGIVEKRYQLAARRIAVSKELAKAAGNQAVGQMASSVLDELRREFVASIEDGDPAQSDRPRRLSGHRLRLTGEAGKFLSRLDDLIADYEVEAGTAVDADADSVLMVALYPQRPDQPEPGRR